jgi:hypothetical protein
LYDYGPPGSSLQANIISEWRKHFIVEEGMLELDTTIMTPAPVFETSGHVARFADWMVKDTVTGDVLRADHLVGGVLEARLAGDKEARGLAAQPKQDDRKKKKKPVKSAAVQLPDEVVKEYEVTLAQASSYSSVPCCSFSDTSTCSWTTTQAQNLVNFAASIALKIQTLVMTLESLSNSISCLRVASARLVNILGTYVHLYP